MSRYLNRVTSDPTAADSAETNSQILGMARGGGLNLIGSVCKQVALLGVMVLLAHVVGQANVGLYAQALAILALLGVLSLSGVMAGLRRFVAVHLAENDIHAVRGTVRLGLGLSTGVAVLLGAALFLATPWLVRFPAGT